MTPQERQMLNELFARLASLENAPRDPEAMRAIDDGLQRAPNALYPLVQTVLVQDEALKRAQARIRELEQELGIEPEQRPQPGGFLDSMRNLLGGREPQGSVPSVRPGPAEHRAQVWGAGGAPQAGYAPAREPAPAGGSFLGTAAATAAGVIGGAMLMNSMRGMFGGQHGMGSGMGHSSTGHGFGSGGQGGTPWAPDGGGELARQAGVDDIGRGGGGGSPGGDTGQRQGLFDTAQNDDRRFGRRGRRRRLRRRRRFWRRHRHRVSDRLCANKKAAGQRRPFHCKRRAVRSPPPWCRP